jgi:hypothetical protein
VPRYPLSTRASSGSDEFLEEFGMPSLLWRVLRTTGYPLGREPRYHRRRQEVTEHLSVYTVEAVVLPRTEHDSEWCRRLFLGDGMTQWEGANVAAYRILQNIMVQFPEVFARATAEAFPRGDPYRPVWGQPGGNALELSSDEAQSSANSE